MKMRIYYGVSIHYETHNTTPTIPNEYPQI